MLSTKLKAAAGNGIASTLYVNDVFSTYLYTGNSSTQTITNGIDLAGKGGMVWIKPRDVGGTNHMIFDTNRNIANWISSNTTTAQTNSFTSLTAFNSDGFNLGSNAAVNNSPDKLTSWTFRKAAKFFDVVTYTGTGSARTIAHSLGVAPGMIIIKSTSYPLGWPVYHRSNGAGTEQYLNMTDAVSYSGKFPSAPTSSSFYISENDYVNKLGETYVAYLFAHDTSSTGIIQCGSYTGNGSVTGPTVSLGWEPQYLMIKNASGTGNWQIIDSMRGMPVGSADATLQANLSSAESSVEYLSPTATGFQITSTSTEVNTNGSTYIYMAIRRPNKPPTSGTQVFGPNSFTEASIPVVTNFPVDMSFYREADVAFSEEAFTRLQGIGVYLTTPSTNAEQLSYLSANYFASNTTFCGSKDGNSRKRTYWNFKRAPGFFDVVCYTGNGVTRTVAHNLTVVPELMIVKERSVASRWVVYHSVLGNTKYIALNESGSPVTSNMWNNTTPTNAVFSVGVVSEVNSNSETYVAYLFATLAGISKVGSYTGNGTGQAIACGFGSGGARFVLIKRTDGGGGGWYTFDSARGLTSGSSPYLLLNSTAAETTGNNGVYASTGGFTLGSTASTTTNINGASYIYLSVA